eukprot:6010247-Alexandrium_andersonii.AAC.1
MRGPRGPRRGPHGLGHWALRALPVGAVGQHGPARAPRRGPGPTAGAPSACVGSSRVRVRVRAWSRLCALACLLLSTCTACHA